ncbi:MAG: hypothetical protein WD939_03510, partial [Dehalococcoidia bacterium]
MRTEIELAEPHRWRVRAASLAQHRPAMAVLVSTCLLALLLAVLLGEPLSVLPAYPAVALAFALAVALPGWLVARALLRDTGLAIQFAAAPALALGLMAVPGVIALEAHLSLDDFALMYAIVAAAAAGATMLFAPATPVQASEPVEPESARGNVLLVAMLAVVLGGVVTTPFWAADRLAGDFDDWTYAAYAREFIDTDRLNAEEPFFGTGEPVNPRMRSNVWVLSEALVSRAAGVAPHEALFEYLPPLLSMLAILAAYAVGRTLFRSSTAGLLAAGFMLGYAFLDLSPHEGIGRNLFLRISEDKMVGGFLLFPIALVFLANAFSSRSAASFAGYALVVLGLSVTHPVPLLFLATTVPLLGALRATAERSFAPLRLAALFLIPVVLVSIWPLVQRDQLEEVTPALFATGEGAAQLRYDFHLVSLGGGWLIGNYHLILHPLMLATIALAPLVWWGARRTVGGQLVLVLMVSPLLLLFVPLLATPVANVLAPSTLWRVPWMIPVAPVLAFVTHQAALQIARGGARLPRGIGAAAPALLPGIALLVVLVAGLAVQEQYLRLDRGAFYTRNSSSALVPGTDGSIFVGGIEGSFSRDWRLRPQQEQLLDHLSKTVPEGSVVLVDSEILQLQMPGYLTHIYPTLSSNRTIYPQGSDRAREVAEQEQALGAFYRGAVPRDDVESLLKTYGVDYVVIGLRSEAETTLRSVADIALEDLSRQAGAP